MERIQFAITSPWVRFNKLLTHKDHFGILDLKNKASSYLSDHLSTWENQWLVTAGRGSLGHDFLTVFYIKHIAVNNPSLRGKRKII